VPEGESIRMLGVVLAQVINGLVLGADVMSWQNAGDPVLMTVLDGMHH
jgi:hypothetical protein